MVYNKIGELLSGLKGNEEALFLTAIIIVCSVLLQATTDISSEAAAVPQIVLIPTLFLSVYLLFNELGYAPLPDSLTGSPGQGMFDVYPSNLVNTLVWVLGYIVSMIHIGFFTTNFVFVYAYIFFNDSSLSGYQRFLIPFFWASTVCTLLYIIIDYFLRIASIYDLGFVI